MANGNKRVRSALLVRIRALQKRIWRFEAPAAAKCKYEKFGIECLRSELSTRTLREERFSPIAAVISSSCVLWKLARRPARSPPRLTIEGSERPEQENINRLSS